MANITYQARPKPKIEDIVKYLKSQIPNCSVNQNEVDDLKNLYPKVSRKDIVRAIKRAVKQRALQPVFYVNQQLRITMPDPFNPGISRDQSFKNGTDWDAKEEQFWTSKKTAEQAYDRQHGRGAWRKKENIEKQKLHNFFVKIETESDKKAQSSKEQYCESKEDKEWLDNLMKELAK